MQHQEIEPPAALRDASENFWYISRDGDELQPSSEVAPDDYPETPFYFGSPCIFWFFSKNEIPCDYRNAEQQRKIVAEQFAELGWRTAELLAEVKQAGISCFDKLCQIKMPLWTKNRVALVGDAGCCASPAVGIGAALAMQGAATVAAALRQHNGDFELAFRAYNQNLRPFREEGQATTVTMLNDCFLPKTEAAVRTRNAQAVPV